MKIRQVAYALLLGLTMLLVALYWTLDLPKEPAVPVTTHYAVVPSYFAHDGPCLVPTLWMEPSSRGPPNLPVPTVLSPLTEGA